MLSQRLIVRRTKLLSSSVVLLSAFFFTATVSASLAKDVTVWVYHNFPPFVIDAEKEEGLSFDIVKRFNAVAGGEFDFKVKILSRGRISFMLGQGENGIVLWTNNLWFGDPEKQKYLWSSALFHDKAAVISPIDAPIEYDGSNSLVGMRLTGIRGFRYQNGVEELIAASQIERIDVGSERQVVQSIASGRSQVSVLADLAARYYVSALGLGGQVHFSKNPFSDFDRIILAQPHMVKEFAAIAAAMKELETDADWQNLLRSYGVQPDNS